MPKTTLRKQIDEFCDENWPDEEILLFGDEDGSAYDAGFIGIGYQQHKGPVAVYDRERCLDALTEEFAADTEIYEGDEAQTHIPMLLNGSVSTPKAPG